MSKIILSAFADEYKTDFDGQLEGLRNFGIEFMELRFVNGTNVAVGTDSWHWNMEDMYSIGQEVGRCIVDEIL